MSPHRRPSTPPELLEEIVGEILLRIPPAEPAHLVRAALVCKPWMRVLSDPSFRRGYREHHRTPPLLGFVHNLDDNSPVPRFVPITASPCSSPALDCRSWSALDSRHGRVLIHRFGPTDLVVWDPITGDQQHLPLPPYSHANYTGAVLCAAAGCDHLDCSGGPFLVVFVGTDDEEAITWASVYSSETHGWSAMTTVDLSDSTAVDSDTYIESRPSLLNGGSLYFQMELGKAILKYDLGRGILSVIDAPHVSEQTGILMTAEEGGLGFAGVEGKTLFLWSWHTSDGDDKSARWTQCRAIELESLLPICNPAISPEVIGFVEGTDTIILDTDVSVSTLEIKSGKTRKVAERDAYDTVIPYTNFCYPVHAAD